MSNTHEVGHVKESVQSGLATVMLGNRLLLVVLDRSTGSLPSLEEGY